MYQPPEFEALSLASADTVLVPITVMVVTIVEVSTHVVVAMV